ncbi:MAG: ester cyclase [Mariniphaga sp.]
MKKVTIRFRILVTFLVVATVAVSAIAQAPAKKASADQTEIAALRKQIKDLTDGNKMVEKYLVKFDTLDYTVFSNQEWVRLHESHSKDIIVHWPDGHFTTGIQKHIEDLSAMFVYAPNTAIKQHPIRFGSQNFTCVTGIMTGSFTKPMPIGGGKFIEPTGKSFSLPMCTVGIWKDGVMTEEYLFWDNQTYMNQLGLGK